MKIGDKVRVTKGTEEGFITKIINEKLVEIEIEDGFRIPVMRNELSIVAAEETNYFERVEEATKVPEVKHKGKAADVGFCLAFHEINDKTLSLFIINNTAYTIPYTIFFQENNKWLGKSVGHLVPQSYFKIDEFDRRTFENWPEIIIQALIYSTHTSSLRSPMEKRFKFKAATFFKTEKIAPLILKKAYLFDIGISPEILDQEKLVSMLQTDREEKKQQEFNTDISRPPSIVDLHIEKISTETSGLSSSQILQLQIQTFEKALDLAIAGGMEEITFIHGVGNGILRDAIHKQLSKASNIEYFKDALRDKFGYGATYVRII